MSEERTYPREWFEVKRWNDEPIAKTFVRETPSMLVSVEKGWGERRTSKHGSYSVWYPTREEAEAVIAARKERRAAANAAERIRNAAPELLKALTAILADCSDQTTPTIRDICRAAIARARGED